MSSEPTSGRSGPAARLSSRRKLLYGLAVAAFFAGTLELGARIYYRARTGSWAIPAKYYPAQSLRYQPDAHLGITLRPDRSYRINDQVITVNTRGFRGPEVAVPKPGGRVRVCCLGGSTTFETRVSSDEAAWPARLGGLLRERHPSADFEVVNCGVPGYTTAESLVNLALRVADLEPDLVVVYHTWNDLKPAQEEGFWSDYSHWRRVPQPSEPGLAVRALRHSLVYMKLERTLRKAREHRTRRAVHAATPRTATLGAEAEAAFRRNLESLVALARARGSRVALATFATRSSQDGPPAEEFENAYTPRFSAEELQRAFRRYAAIVRETAADQGAWVVDAQARLTGRDGVFADFVHFTDEGARAMAELVYEELAAQGAWDELVSD